MDRQDLLSSAPQEKSAVQGWSESNLVTDDEWICIARRAPEEAKYREATRVSQAEKNKFSGTLPQQDVLDGTSLV